MRILLLLCWLLYAFEGALYSALAPLMPVYARDLDVSIANVGLLVGMYTITVTPGTTLGSALATLRNGRLAAVAGLLAMTAATLLLSVADSVALLYAARALQGIAGGIMWAGALRWLMDVTPISQPGDTIGHALGAATTGTIAGPAIGTSGIALNPGVVFGIAAALTIVLAVALATQPLPLHRLPTTPIRGLYKVAAVRHGAWVIAVPSATLGAILALMPTRLVNLGLDPVIPGLILIGTAILAARLHRWAGHRADRRDPTPLIAASLTLATAALLVLATTNHWFVVAVATATIAGPLYATTVTPATAIMTGVVTGVGGAHIVPVILMAAVAGGEGIGSSCAGLLAALASWLPYTLLATLSALTAIWLALRVRRDSANRRPRPHPSE